MKKFLSLALCLLFAVSLAALPASALSLLRDPLNPDVFTAAEDDGNLNYNFKDSGGAWVNLMNPWGASVYIAITPSAESIQSFILTFEVSGYDGGEEGYRAMAGFGINGWSPSVWSLDADGADGANWEDIFGRKHYFVIDGDGYYRMIISFRAAMDWFEGENDWYIKDWLENVDCLELGIFGPGGDTAMAVRIVDLEESEDIFSFENVQRLPGSDSFFSATGDFGPLPDPEPPREPRIGEEGDNGDGDNGDSGDNGDNGDSGDGDSGDGDNRGGEDPGDSGEPDPTPAEPEASPPPPPPPASDDSGGGGNVWIWVVIGVVVVVAAAAGLVIVKKKGGKP